MATEITKLTELPYDEFANRVNAAIKLFPGNMHRKNKTINNWRTEISALFGFIITENGITKPGLRAIELSTSQDLVESFKVYLFNFQYPGGHIKPHETYKMIEAGIRFKPAQYILKLLQYAEKESGNRVGVTKAEVTHCIFNDLRCIRDNEDVSLTWLRINENRDHEIEYDQTGDVVRCAGDIIDYMEIANLLVTHDGKNYYINNLESEAILKFVNSTHWFTIYDKMIHSRTADLAQISSFQKSWFEYVNRDVSDTDFQTDILAFISNNPQEYDELKKSSLELIKQKLGSGELLVAKDIGDIGEGLVHGHECERVKIGGREELIHLIKRIPTQFAVGYDIQSVELDARKRYIEVKTTISSKPLQFNKIHLTTNEWNTAESIRDRYFVYRLLVSKYERKLFVMQDPVGLYKQDILQMVPRDGADITFNPNDSGAFEELLSWEN
jgi:hypothetical protein